MADTQDKAKETAATTAATTAAATATPSTDGGAKKAAPKKAGGGGGGGGGNKKGGGKGGKKGNMIDTEPQPGTRDFLPDDMRVQRWLFDQFREVARLFAFQEYDAPLLESATLYTRKGGEEIKDQIYAFTDKGEREVSLRPEMTPSLARLVLKQGKKMLMPQRFYSIPQCWRYENTTRGRRREHYQWNMDIFGVPSVTGEAELLAAMVAFFKRVGLRSSDVCIKINSRRVLQEILEPLGVTDELFPEVCIIVDKMDKLPKESVVEMLAARGLPADTVDRIVTTLAIADIDELEKAMEKMGAAAAATAATAAADGDDKKKPAAAKKTSGLDDLKQVFEYARAYGFVDWLVFDASIVRGLAYYTGLVFEAKDRKGALRAICGGGRYDKLLTLYGGREDIPACGFGFGDCVIIELLKDLKLLPDLTQRTDIMVVAFDEKLRGAALGVTAQLRDAGVQVDMQMLLNRKIQWCFNYADRVGAERVVFVAPDEWAKGLVRVKEMRAPDARQKDEKKSDEKKEDEKKDDESKEYNVTVAELLEKLVKQ